jgi:hypothetical protein
MMGGMKYRPRAHQAVRSVAFLLSLAAGRGSAADIPWCDDAVPTGAQEVSGGDAWNWVSANPAPFHGSVAHQSNLAAGLHEHFFNFASADMSVGAGDTLFCYVYIDPANSPSEIMLSWNAGSWEHRAYWGADSISYGTDATPSRQHMGPVPAAGAWVRLSVPASVVGLEGEVATGMGFSEYNGRATWDYSGDSPLGSSKAAPPPPPGRHTT